MGDRCRDCGHDVRVDARFCDGCGARLASEGGRAEYKQVTVLFADVVHSMDIAAAVGAERLREIMAELFSRSSAVVRRFGGTVDKFTGDGLMAVFGAPVALEDHAFRACLAALELQVEAGRLGADVERRDGVALQLRVGLNSGEVIAGEIGSGAASYTTVGEQVGLAQRMESVAPPGGVMVSASTARLVEETATLGEPEHVHIKGGREPIPARRLLGVGAHRGHTRRSDPALVGRGWELGCMSALLDEACDGTGSVVAVVGPPGIGKSRIVRESTGLAATRGVEVVTAYCESHTSDVPFHAVTGLARAALGITELDCTAARERVRAQLPNAQSDDLLLLDDLLGVADPDVALPDIGADARRRRLTALINAASTARASAVVHVIEDVHWIDEASESMLVDFLLAVPHTRSLVLMTYRPEYRGALTRVPGAQTINLRPLSSGQSLMLIGELLGAHRSAQNLAERIAERADGNPFFAEEMVRDLAERGVLSGARGAYESNVDITDVDVPATLQTTIAARIDRLGAEAKRTVRAAAVVGSRFSAELLERLGVRPAFDELVDVELIEQVQFYPSSEFTFRHPLIRTVAYETQLRSDRAELHRRLAAAMEERDRESDERAAQIAEHLEAAGDLHSAFTWHMKAGGWLTNRDIVAARASWLRAYGVADRLSPESPGLLAMRIAPRTLLCASAFRGGNVADTGFDELRELCTTAGDRRSLAIAMAGLPVTFTLLNRHREASRLASEQVELLEAIGDPTMTVALMHGAMVAKFHSGALSEAILLAQRVIDLADGEVASGEVLIGSPLAQATMIRGLARAGLAVPGWRTDFDAAYDMSRSSDDATRVIVGTYPYGMLIQNGALVPDATCMNRAAEGLRIAEESGDDFTLSMARFVQGIALLRTPEADHVAGVALLEQARDAVWKKGNLFGSIPARIELATNQTRLGDVDGGIDAARAILTEVADGCEMIMRGPVTVAMVEALLARGGDSDIAEAQAAIELLAATPSEPGFVLFVLPSLRLRALLALAKGAEVDFAEFRKRYSEMAKSVDFGGHIALAAAMEPT